MKPSKMKEAKLTVERAISDHGGYSKETLKKLGVPWPPKKGWKNALIRQMARDGNMDRPVRTRTTRKGFYSSWEWKAVRYEAIRTSGQRCSCCGWQPGDTKHGYLVVDHIKPRSKFPDLELEPTNLQVLCNDCNMGKSNLSCDDWRDMDERYKATIS